LQVRKFLMAQILPLEVLFEADCGSDLPLPDDLKVLYGRLQFPPSGTQPHVIGNFVATLDGVVSLGIAGKTDGDEISGSNLHDSFVMGLLRAASDAVIVGAGTLHQSPQHVWTPEFVFPSLDASYRMLRARLGRENPPVCAVVSARGALDLDLPVFTGEKAPVAIITTARGEEEIRKKAVPPGVRVIPAGERESLSIREILDALLRFVPGGDIFLVEGGPRLIGQFFDQGELDELFLTLSPLLAGRDSHAERPGLISGTVFLPGRLVAGRLNGLRKGGNHLFLRYAFKPQI
jgi:riboflavin biosynthesis pyrimidine reductase